MINSFNKYLLCTNVPGTWIRYITKENRQKLFALRSSHFQVERQKKIAFIEKWNLRKTCERLNYAKTCGKIILGRKNSQCEGPKAEACQARANKDIQQCFSNNGNMHTHSWAICLKCRFWFSRYPEREGWGSAFLVSSQVRGLVLLSSSTAGTMSNNSLLSRWKATLMNSIGSSPSWNF